MAILLIGTFQTSLTNRPCLTPSIFCASFYVFMSLYIRD